MNYDNSKHSEDKIQADCYQWFHNSFPALRGLLFAIPNGGSRDIREAMKLKATGVVKGIADICFAIGSRSEAGQWYNALYIEMKKPGGKLSDDQIKIHDLFQKHGNAVAVCRDLPHFREIILYWLQHSEIDPVLWQTQRS